MHSGNDRFKAALEAMDAEELRAFLREFSRRLEPKGQARIQEALLQHASKASGWKPLPPPSHTAARVNQFVAAARELGVATPEQVDELLREGNQAFRAGDMPVARAIFEPLLRALSDAEFDLGQDETYDEVLTESLPECAGRYLVAVYLTTPLPQRAEALKLALESTEAVGSILEPLHTMEQAANAPLPELSTFLPSWVSVLRSQPTSSGGPWENPGDRWLREAVTRAEGSEGLGQLAQSTKQPETLRAWCKSLVEQGQWKQALRAFEDASRLVESRLWKGDFLDGAALSAHELGHRNLTQRLATAWRTAPSLARLLRWLAAGAPSTAALKKRASLERARPPRKSARLMGVLDLVAGDFEAAAKRLAVAPGLDWSDDEHPGPVLFAACVWLLGEPPANTLCSVFVAPLRQPPSPFSDLEEWDEELDPGLDEEPFEPELPRLALPAPDLLSVLRRAELERHLLPATRQLLRDALRMAARTRVAGVLHDKHRREYAHAAQLVACCVEVEHAAGQGDLAAHWAAALLEETKRFPAFQAELRSALEQAHLDGSCPPPNVPRPGARSSRHLTPKRG